MLKVASYRMAELQKRVDSFNRKADKLSMAHMSIVIHKTYEKEVNVCVGEVEGEPVMSRFTVTLNDVTIEGAIPMVGGWSIQSRVEQVEPGLNFVFTNPVFEEKPEQRTMDMHCDHCGHKRQRKQVFVLVNEQGEQKVVGHTCLKDFIPNAGVEDVMAYIQALVTVNEYKEDEDFDRCPRDWQGYERDEALAEAVVLIKKFGYVSKKMVEENPMLMSTASDMGAFGAKRRELLYPQIELEAARPIVAEILEWVNANEDPSEFWHNVRIAVRSEVTRVKLFAYLAAAVMMFNKSKMKPTPTGAVSQYVGKVGEKIELTNVKVGRVTAFEGASGYWVFAHNMELEDGSKLVWFASKRVFGENSVVEKMIGTVKDQKESRGVKETILTRCKAL